ncbi:MAG: hypothetical protein H6625_10105 [Bdellovibrionaceae bacterium]|nr:hypothetical protein [Pseudobdellovibrionaceae bacterium]
MSQHNKKEKEKPGLKWFSLIIMGLLMTSLNLGCDDKKRPIEENVFSFENNEKTQQVHYDTQNLAKISTDSLSQLHRLLSYSFDSTNELDKISNACAIKNVKKDLPNKTTITIDWRNINCRMGLDKYKFTLKGNESILIDYAANKLPTRIRLWTKNLQVLAKGKTVEVVLNTEINIDSVKNTFDFSQFIYSTEVSGQKDLNIEWETHQEGTGSINFKLKSMIIDTVHIESTYEKYKVNKAQQKFYLAKHKMESVNSINNDIGKPLSSDVYFDNCGVMIGNFSFIVNYNDKTKLENTIYANNKQFVFAKPKNVSSRVACTNKEPYFYKSLVYHTLVFKKQPTAVVGKAKERKAP